MAVRIRARVRGMQKVINNLNKQIKKITFTTNRGLLKAGFFISRASQQKVPVDTGALKASVFVESIGTQRRPAVLVGYGQYYAIFVHENMTARHGPARLPFTISVLILCISFLSCALS